MQTFGHIVLTCDVTLYARPITPEETALIAFLVNEETTQSWRSTNAMVKDSDDGGMGGFSFVSTKEHRTASGVIAECSFADHDGVEVWATLISDQDGELFELEMWKVNFEPLVQIPDASLFFRVEQKRDGG